eukprot:CAMPEP_0201521126 /NCGR_PEP_ID=MMETSP0161_2-20130828/14235_1 /ASSEMBLY_ACC=CAM_ASM_000251 /TAXON_ID=180227 /ORGANISM="Neoparamoeba aestuarina, Strain SoJaBio B1-5/56/2" /LENGTH=349 /DNA_ID=CAMNT_0047919703 /DNA_START=80 /DNA_END=1129 /DNA_ORIENTATION=-
MWWKIGAAFVVTTGVVLYNAPLILDNVLVLSCFPRDEVIGDALVVGEEELTKRLKGTSALVVGGTKGIGRGMARVMASSGGNVWVMGRSAASTVALLEESAVSVNTQKLRGVPANLYTKDGCIEAVRHIKEDSPPDAAFDYVVFTVGQWPDRENPNTEEGTNKVLALDVYARFTVFEELQKQGLIAENGRVMNILASTVDVPGAALTEKEMKEILSQGKNDFNLGGMKGILSTACICADNFVVTAASRYPTLSFIGAHPGLVQTDLVSNSNAFSPVLAELAKQFSSILRVDEIESGRRLCSILTSENVKKRNYSFFNALGHGRLTHQFAYNKDFGAWLWNNMEHFGAQK